MNTFSLICITAALVALLPVIAPVIQAVQKQQAADAKERRDEEWHRQRLRNSETLAQNRDALREHQVGKWSNDVVKKDLEIEMLKLKIKQLEKELREGSRWTPYDDPDTPAPR